VSRTSAVLLLALVLVGAYLGMWRGWRRRVASQAELPPLPSRLPASNTLVGPVEAVYLGTTSAGDWLDRVAVHKLGRRSPAVVTVTIAGVAIDRGREPRVDIPVSALLGVRKDMAGALRASRTEQLLVLTWRHGGRQLETVVRPRHRADLARLLSAIDPLVVDGTAA
jgi:hypothetical protein